MIEFSGRGVLLDVEGTTSSVSFVYDVMFPLVREQLEPHLAARWGEDSLTAACEQIARDAGHEGLRAWCGERDPQPVVREEVLRLMDDDVKATGLKQLQGQIWKGAFQSGQLQAHLFDEVAAAMRRWRDRGRDIRIYSSGSVQAQRLFFGHTIHGDLLPLISGHYDTTTGPKKEAASYAAIADDWRLAPAEILFASDVVAELDAARRSGLQTVLCLRPGNAPAPAGHGHSEIRSFDEI